MTGLASGGAVGPLVVAVLWSSLIAWLLVRAIRQMHAYAVLEPDGPPRGETGTTLSEIAVIVPVRNEAETIERCMRGLLAQDYPADRLSIVVVDDSSTDATAELAQELASAVPNARVLSEEPLPSGWAGKPHACWRGALATGAEWLCFIDADTAAEPALLRRAVAVAEAQGFDMLSLEPFLELGSFWERLIIPAGLLAMACTLDVRRVGDPETPTAPVNGQFLLVRREVYFAVGGHDAVRAEIAEDSALALRLKRAGYRLGLYGADRLIRVRMYHGLAGLWEGLSKNVTEVFGGTLPTLSVAAAGFLLGWATVIVPLWVALAVAPAATLPAYLAILVASLGSLTVTATEIAAAFHFRIPWWYGLLFPLGFTAAALLAVNGVMIRARGRVAWKGRVYSVPQRAHRPGS